MARQDSLPIGYSEARNFCEGLRAVRSSESKCWGFIDETKKEVIECKYSFVTDFHGGYAFVMKDNHLYLINKIDKIIIDLGEQSYVMIDKDNKVTTDKRTYCISELISGDAWSISKVYTEQFYRKLLDLPASDRLCRLKGILREMGKIYYTNYSSELVEYISKKLKIDEIEYTNNLYTMVIELGIKGAVKKDKGIVGLEEELNNIIDIAFQFLAERIYKENPSTHYNVPTDELSEAPKLK